MPDISSRQHPVVKAFKSAVHNEPRHALLDGWHLLHDAVEAGIAIEKVLISAPPPTDASARILERVAHTADVFSVSTAVMDVASPVRTPAGVVALARRRASTLAELLSASPGLVIVAIDIQDPGNVGAIIRSAEAGGATGVALAGACADGWGWKALRASMGSTFRLPILQQPDARAAVASLAGEGVRVLAAVPRGGLSMDAADLKSPTALLLGGEGGGLTGELFAAADAAVSIPMVGPVESLNVAVAAALLVYEARRQRTTV